MYPFLTIDKAMWKDLKYCVVVPSDKVTYGNTVKFKWDLLVLPKYKIDMLQEKY